MCPLPRADGAQGASKCLDRGSGACNRPLRRPIRRGVNVAVVDSGVDGLHPDLASRVVANFKVAGALPVTVNGCGTVCDATSSTPEEVVQCPAACNSDTTGGHGTHVAGIIAGDGT